MRILLVFPLLLVAACNVERDEGNGTTTVEFNEDVAENTAADIANGAEDVAEGAANVAAEAGDAIQNEVGDVDVDVDVNRTPPANSN